MPGKRFRCYVCGRFVNPETAIWEKMDNAGSVGAVAPGDYEEWAEPRCPRHKPGEY